jgi:hypothetical protein
MAQHRLCLRSAGMEFMVGTPILGCRALESGPGDRDGGRGR